MTEAEDIIAERERRDREWWERHKDDPLVTGTAKHRMDDHGQDIYYDTSTWNPRDLASVRDGSVRIEEPAYLLRDDGVPLLYPGRSHSFFGPSESLKTWVALLACKSVIDAGGRVVYLDFEDDMFSFVERCDVVGLDIATDRLVYVRPEEPLRTSSPSGWDLDDIVKVKPDLVVIDGVSEVYTLHGWDVMNTNHAVLYQHMLLRGFEDGVATLEIDHTAKTAGSGQFGAQQKKAGIDGASYEFKSDTIAGRGGHSIVNIFVSKDRHGFVRRSQARNGYIGRFHLDDTGDTPRAWLAAPAPGPRRDDDLSTMSLPDRVHEWLLDNDLATTSAVRKCGLASTRDVMSAVDELVAAGRVVVHRGARGAQLHHAVQA